MSPAPPPENRRMEDQLSYPILLSDRIRKAVSDAVFFKLDCSDVGKHVDRLSNMLRSAVRLSSVAGAQLYDRPVRRISGDVSRNLHRALSLVRRCRRLSFLHRVVRMVTAADFKKVLALLEASIADMCWLVSVLDCTGTGGNLSIPPVASNDPIIAWVWSYIATVQMSGEISDRVEAASELAALAEDNDRNKQLIVEEGGIPPLLRLLKESSSPEAQIAAANVLNTVANHRERVKAIVDSLGIPAIVQVLNDSPMKVQIRVSELVATMAEHDSFAKEQFARENVIRPLVSLLSFETFEPELNRRLTFHSIVQINNDNHQNRARNPKPVLSSSLSMSAMYSEMVSSRALQSRKERENETPEVKRELKISCSKALWKLAKDSLSNSQSISETKGLLCLAKLIEKESGELRKNCLMAIAEITLAAESNAELRRSAFKVTSPAARAVVDQLLRVVRESDDSGLLIPAIRSLGALARTFPARETRVIGPLVSQLDNNTTTNNNNNVDVAVEAAIALGKFASPENFLWREHSRAIIESNGLPPLMRLVRGDNKRAQAHGLVLLCYLAINATKHRALEQTKVLAVLQSAAQQAASEPVGPEEAHTREMIGKAISHLNLYRGDSHTPQRHTPQRHPSLRK